MSGWIMSSKCLQSVKSKSSWLMLKRKSKSCPPTDFWYRIGSHRFEFFATDEEIQQFFSNELPEKYAPYSLITTLEKRGDRDYVRKLREQPLGNLLKLAAETRNIFLRSKQLTPDLGKAMGQF